MKALKTIALFMAIPVIGLAYVAFLYALCAALYLLVRFPWLI